MVKINSKKNNESEKRGNPVLNKVLSFFRKVKKQVIPRSKLVRGEELPHKEMAISKSVKRSFFLLGVFLFILIKMVVTAVYFYLPVYVRSLAGKQKGIWKLFISKHPIGVFRLLFGSIPMMALLFSISISVIAVSIFYSRYKFRNPLIAYGQKGDNDWLSIKELKQQFHQIPDVKKRFEGIGGFPISHLKNAYYITRNTLNTLIIGTSRSGKTESIIFPFIDILSRALKQCSMIINDPKGEILAASKEILEKRGYLVRVLNLINPSQSMGYDLLHLIKEEWKRGNKESAQLLTNSLTYGLYHDPEAGMNKWVHEGAQRALSGMILALLEEADKTREYKKVTIYNAGQLLIELGSNEWTDPITKKEKNGLDEYFASLPQGSMAKVQYGSTKLAGDRTKGSILMTVQQGIDRFQFTDIAKMTSTNSFDMKSVGFPKWIDFSFSSELANKRLKVLFVRDGKIIGKETIKPNNAGFSTLNFDYHLRKGDQIQIEEKPNVWKKKAKESIGKVILTIQSFSEEKDCKVELYTESSMDLFNDAFMYYHTKPVAVFLVIPDFDESLHTIATNFIKQCYTTLAQNCSFTRGGKCFRRVHFILDEFGNMPAIEGMKNIITVCAGRNILFNLFVQSYTQLYATFGEKIGKIIKENCQIKVYIKSEDGDTNEEFSKMVGHKTDVGEGSTDLSMVTDNNRNRSADQNRLITVERLSSLLEGESVVLRYLDRKTTSGKDIRPFPIFNTKEQRMPLRYKFPELKEDFPSDNDINDFDFESDHEEVDLNELVIDFQSWIADKKKREILETFSVESFDELNSDIETERDKVNYFSTLEEVMDYYHLSPELKRKLLMDYTDRRKFFLMLLDTINIDQEAKLAIQEFILREEAA